MKRTALVIKIICISLLILVSLIWLCLNIANYGDYKDAIESSIKSVELKDYIAIIGGVDFFCPIFVLILGVYQLFNILSGIKLRSSSETTIALLAQYKSFLDQGVITQDEFNAKKKQLLGL